MKILNGSKKIEIPNVKKLNFLQKGFGLMFRRKESCPALLFEFKKPEQFHLTSFFVFFPFVAIWLDKNNKILGKKIVKPWNISVLSSVRYYYKILEIPINKFYLSKVKNLVEQKI